MKGKLLVLLVDDHPVVCAGLRLLLEGSAKFSVCGEAGDVTAARRLVAELRPDLIVLDLELGGRDGAELINELCGLRPAARILIYSTHDEQTYARRMLRAGARGYVMKAAGLAAVATGLETVSRGECYVSAEMQRSLVEDLGGRRTATMGARLETLSDRELQIFRLLGAGAGSAAISAQLHLGIKTVGTYRERLKEKLGLSSARELERCAETFVRTGHLHG